MEILDTRTDIGLIRDNNEDASIAIYHPKSKNLKLLIVADGMGGKEHGEFASNFVVEKLKKWFIEHDTKTLNDAKKTRDLLIKYIKRLNTEIIKKCGNNRSGTTLTMSIIGKRKSIIANVGDSRAYIYKDQELIQITEDDSDVWYYHKFANIEKEDLRFFSNNNIINAIYAFGVCFILIYIYEKYKTLKAPILMHICLNTTIILMLNLIVKNFIAFNIYLLVISIIILLILKLYIKKDV